MMGRILRGLKLMMLFSWDGEGRGYKLVIFKIHSFVYLVSVVVVCEILRRSGVEMWEAIVTA